MWVRGVKICLAIILCLTAAVALAQTDDLTPYSWDAAGLSLGYPAGWDEPVPSEQDGQIMLQLAQTLAASPETRPPGVPVINFTLYIPETLPLTEAGEIDFATLVEQQFSGLSLATGEINGGAAGETLTASGSSTDNLLFGLLRASTLPDGRVLIVTGRAVEAQRETFTPLFEAVANSLQSGIGLQPQAPAYGVLWHTVSTLADGENAFVNLSDLAYAGERLYTVDGLVGVIEISAATGEVTAVYPNPDFALPVALAASEGRVYVADTVCQCVHVLNTSDGTWGAPLTGFGTESPASIALTPNGDLYATNLTDAGVEARIFTATGETTIPFGAEIVTQPLLATNADRVLALTTDGLVVPVEEGDFAPLYTLNLGTTIVTDFALLPGDRLLLATAEQGVLIAESTGEIVDAVGSVVATSPLPGEFASPRGVVIAADGSIFVADSDGSFGAITAMSASVDSGRIGSTTLIPGVLVGGTLSPDTPSQDWTLNAVAGQVVTIAAIDAGGQGALDVALRLIAPDGGEEITNDDQGGDDPIAALDAQILNYTLAASGAYTVRVEAVAGNGSYQLGVAEDKIFELHPEGATQLNGQIQAALPAQRWVFQGQAGQVFTLTMQADTGTLDPLLRLWDARGNIVAENDDAEDLALGKNAQIVQISLPADGTYTLEAGRFSGEGAYTLVIVATS